jgi:hypothetical protein
MTIWLEIGACVVALAAIVLFGRRLGRFGAKFLGIGIEAEAKEHGVVIRKAKSHKGSIKAIDETGTRAELDDVEAQGDIHAVTKKDTDPKH